MIDFVTNIINAIIALLHGDFDGFFSYLQGAFNSAISFVKNIIQAVINFIIGFLEGFGVNLPIFGIALLPYSRAWVSGSVTDLRKHGTQ